MDYAALQNVFRTSPKSDFIPPAFKMMNIDPVKCSFILTNNMDKGPKDEYRYVLAWEQNETRKVEMLNRPRKVKSKKKLETRCDGPCQRIYPVSELRTMGRCDHLLCSLCQGLIMNRDGSMGCSSFSCVYQSLYYFLPAELARKNYDVDFRDRMLEKEERLKKGVTSIGDLPNMPKYCESNVFVADTSASSDSNSGKDTTTTNSVQKTTTTRTNHENGRLVSVTSSATSHFSYSTNAQNSISPATITSKSVSSIFIDDRSGAYRLEPKRDKNDNVTLKTASDCSFHKTQSEALLLKFNPAIFKSYFGPFESDVIFVRLVVFLRDQETSKTKKIYTSSEVPASYRVRSAISCMLKKRIKIPSFNVVYVFNPRNNEKRKLTKEERLNEIQFKQIVHLIVDTVDLLVA